MDVRKTCMERAFDLAGSGTFRDVVELKRKLNAEGYEGNQIYGRGLSVQLRTIMRAAASNRLRHVRSP